MSRIMKAAPLVVSLLLTIAVPSAWAYWVQDGVAICTATLDQVHSAIISDGAGGAIVTWEGQDYRGGSKYDTGRQSASLLFQTEHLTPAPPRQTQTNDSFFYYFTLIKTRARVCGIQFDDGYISHYTAATPILRQYGLIGSFGIVTVYTDTNPNFMTSAQILEMYTQDNFDFQDHTWDHNAALWGDTTQSATWEQHTAWSRQKFASIGLPDTMRAWNQPGGTGEGWSAQLRNHLKRNGMRYAAGRVGLNWYQTINMHYGSIDDPFSWGRWCYSWGWNAPAAALESQGVDLYSPEGKQLLEAVVAIIDGNKEKSHGLLLNALPAELTMAQSVAAAWTWQAEFASIKSKYADAWACGGFPIVVFHSINADAAAGLDALCAWLVANNAVVLGMDDLNALAQMDRLFLCGINIAPPIHLDLDGNGRQDGSWVYAFMDAAGNASNDAGTTFYGAPPGKLVVSMTMRVPLLANGTDAFTTVYEKYSIDPQTWAYIVSPDDVRQHVIAAGQTLIFTDTLDIGERVDRVQLWVRGINGVNTPFIIDEWSAVPLQNPTGVTDGRLPPLLAVNVAPNPTSGITAISFHLDRWVGTTVAIYDIRGRLVKQLLDHQPLNGHVSLPWRNDNLASGVYFARVTAGSAVTTKKIILVR